MQFGLYERILFSVRPYRGLAPPCTEAMLISYRKNFLFVHIAKTGGTSIRAALRPYRWGGWYSIPLWAASQISQLTRPRHKLGLKFPRHAKAIAAKEMLPEQVYRELFKCAIVRKPLGSAGELLASHSAGETRGTRRDQDLRRFPAPEVRSGAAVRLHAGHLGGTAARIHRDLQGRVIVDFIGRYENLNEDFDTICQHIGIPTPALPHLRRATERDDYRTYYDDTLAEIVAQHYHRDLEVLGYTFDPPDPAGSPSPEDQ